MCDCFKNTEADYQITDLIENIDLARILRENKKAGCEYVFILTENDFALFLTKKFANRIAALDLMEIKDVGDNGDYGFSRTEATAEGSSGVVVGVPGNVIRSTGFIKYVNGRTCSCDLLIAIIKNLEVIEEYIELDRQSNLAKMNVVKVIAG